MRLFWAVGIGITFMSLLTVGQPVEKILNISTSEEFISPTITINIALYGSISPSVLQAQEAMTYSWGTSDGHYEMIVDLVDKPEVVSGQLTEGNYDVFIIAASGRQYFHGVSQQWKEEVTSFIYNGGGYVGICGGANIVSLGFEQPRTPLDFLINQAALGIANVYINDEQDQEWQYLWKDTGADHIPIRTWIDTTVPVFNGHYQNWRDIVYGGGPGMYLGDRLGLSPVQPIAIYQEEPMRKASLHYWRPSLSGLVIWKNVTTDIAGQWAGILTSYGAGTMILLGDHPEIPPMLKGSIEEFFGVSIYGSPRMVYQWTDGEQLPLDYNWWIIRRSIAWASGVVESELPPII